MKLSLSKRTGLIVIIALFVSLSIMLFTLLKVEEDQKIKMTTNNIKELSRIIKESVSFSMAEGTTDISSLIVESEKSSNILDMNLKPTQIISSEKNNLFDKDEGKAVTTGEDIYKTIEQDGTPIFKSVSVLKSSESCIDCHDSKIGDALATLTIQYSLVDLNESIADQRQRAIIFGLLTLLIAVGSVYLFINKQVIKDLLISVNVIKNLSEGKNDKTKLAKRDDEIGILNESLIVLMKNLKHQSITLKEIANGNLDVEVKMLSEEDRLGNSIQTIKSNLQILIKDISGILNAAIEGKLDERMSKDKQLGDYNLIVNGINQSLDNITMPVMDGASVMEQMSTGDLTVQVTADYKGDHQIIKNCINHLGESLNSLVNKVARSIKSTQQMSIEISESVSEMLTSAETQKFQIAEVASSSEEMNSTIYDSAKNIKEAAQIAETTGEYAEKGGQKVSETINGMHRIESVVKDTAETIIELGDSIGQIGQITNVIDDIADQTNLLALNAAIEAARAGEQGRGFAVVADEVRKLAERTTKATKEIGDMICKIQSNTDGAVSSIKKGTEEVMVGKDLVNEAGQALQKIINVAKNSENVINQVAAASEEQSAAYDQISKSVIAIDRITENNYQLSTLISNSTGDMNALISDLQNLINEFTIKEEKVIQKNEEMVVAL